MEYWDVMWNFTGRRNLELRDELRLRQIPNHTFTSVPVVTLFLYLALFHFRPNLIVVSQLTLFWLSFSHLPYTCSLLLWLDLVSYFVDSG